AFQGEPAVAVNCRQQIVEVVRYAASELANSFHFLRLAKLIFALAQCLLHLFSFGNVPSDALYADGLPVLNDNLGIYFNWNPTAILGDNLELVRGHLFAGELSFKHFL